MLEDDSPRDAANMLANVTKKSTATSDFHFLACLARFHLEPEPERTAKVAQAILNLDRKLTAGNSPGVAWPVRLNEVVELLIAKDPSLGDALVDDPSFATPGHWPLLAVLPPEPRTKALRLHAAAILFRLQAAFHLPEKADR
jgi:hypothetical protein